MTFLMAMVPVIELRGAIPYAMANGMTYWEAFVPAVLGNVVPVPFIILFSRKLLKWLGSKHARLQSAVDWLDRRTQAKTGTVNRYRWFGLMVLVAIPLPGTGAWTGALVASALNMRVRDAMTAITLGVIIAGIIVATLMHGVQTVVID